MRIALISCVRIAQDNTEVHPGSLGRPLDITVLHLLKEELFSLESGDFPMAKRLLHSPSAAQELDILRLHRMASQSIFAQS